MQTYTVGELKTRFSEVIEQVKKGRNIVISYGRRREKIAVIVPYSTYGGKRQRTLGLLKDKARCVIHEGFDMTEEEILSS
jgi:prevent-host-death family protein